ncbi:MAG: LCP family protein, partial [Firmicutes bacterium]|nr:LCP family protein [Bacillota bacterium]
FTTVDGAYSFEGGVETHVDGTQALAFARERKAFSDGDFQRNRDQQIVMAAILKKVTQSSTLLLNYTDILAAVEGNMATNLSAADIKELVRAQADEMSGWSIETQNILGVGSMEPCYSAGYAYASVVLQDADSIATATARIREVMEAE